MKAFFKRKVAKDRKGQNTIEFLLILLVMFIIAKQMKKTATDTVTGLSGGVSSNVSEFMSQ